MNFNKVILVGRLANDPEVRYTPEGVMVASFRLAVNRPVQRGAERQADFFPVVTFRRLAEFAQSYLTKGRLILVEGSLRAQSYTDRMGTRRTRTDVIASSIQFMERKPEGVMPATTGLPTALESDLALEQDVPIDDAIFEELPPLEEEGIDEFPF